MRCVVLLSGGIDSSTTLAIARDMGYDLHALTIMYGQRHDREIGSARKVAASMGVKEHRVIKLADDLFLRCALTGEGDIPTDRTLEEGGIPSTYVPARNLIFLSLAVGLAEVIDADAVMIGATAVDYSGYPDCRPEFLSSFQETSRLATRRGMEGKPIKVLYPLVNMPKDEIIRKGIELGLDHSLTWSCYSGGERACGRCDSCRFRMMGFSKAGLKDPIEYE